MAKAKPWTVISVGGSLVVPDAPDVKFLKKFKKMILQLAKKHRVLIIVGGGKTSRRYIEAAKKSGLTKRATLDSIGIAATRMNAELVRETFGKSAHGTILMDPRKAPRNANIVIGGGWKPGFSTDYVAVQAAISVKAKRMINISNTPYVYTKNPHKYKGAKPKACLTWNEMQKIVGTTWSPGLSRPFDPVAVKYAKEKGILVAHIGGNNLEEAKKFLRNDIFKGTLIGYDPQAF